MSRSITVYGLYFINTERTHGHSDFFKTYEEALNAMIRDESGDSYIIEHTYDPED